MLRIVLSAILCVLVSTVPVRADPISFSPFFSSDDSEGSNDPPLFGPQSIGITPGGVQGQPRISSSSEGGLVVPLLLLVLIAAAVSD